jgi:hypothetical protein
MSDDEMMSEWRKGKKVEGQTDGLYPTKNRVFWTHFILRKCLKK